MSKTLCRRYLNKLASPEYYQCTLMDLFIDQKAKNALHKPDTDLKTVALNF